MSNIYVIRHGQASFGKANYDQLTGLGFEQSQILAKHLSALGVEFDSIYAGQNRRHVQTLEAYQQLMSEQGNEVSVQKRAAFNEYDFEDVLRTVIPVLIQEDSQFERDAAEMLTNNVKFQAVFETSLFKWLEDPQRFKTLESWADFSRRVAGELNEIMEEHGSGKNLAIFTSGGVIAAMIQTALNLSDKNTLKLSWQILNASITRFKYRGQSLMMAGFNDIGCFSVLPQKEFITYR